MLVQLIEEAYLREAEEQGFMNKIRAGLGNIKNSVSDTLDSAAMGALKIPTVPGTILGRLAGAGLGAYLGTDNVDEFNGLIDGSDAYAPVAATGAVVGAGLGSLVVPAAQMAAIDRAMKNGLFGKFYNDEK